MSLVRPSRIEAGEPAGFAYRFALDGRPVTELRPYLDAPLHLAVVKEGLTHFVHEHGAVPGEPAAAHAHHPSSHDHGHHGYVGPATFGPVLTATLSFPAVDPEEASRLALAIVAGADIAPGLAADLLDRHVDTIRTLEHAAMNSTARPDYEKGGAVVTFELDATTRKCLLLVSALNLVAAEPGQSAA